MIIDLLLYSLSYFLKFLALLLPDWSIPQQFLDGVIYFYSNVLSLAGLFPIGEAVSVLYILFLFEGVILTMKVITSLINFVRGTGQIK